MAWMSAVALWPVGHSLGFYGHITTMVGTRKSMPSRRMESKSVIVNGKLLYSNI